MDATSDIDSDSGHTLMAVPARRNRRRELARCVAIVARRGRYIWLRIHTARGVSLAEILQAKASYGTYR